jgi:hypothetical protein
LIFNANPLLRYDGYYIAGDLLEITNLGGKASDALRQIAGRLCLGLKYQVDELAPTRGRFLFAAYAVASAAYRAFVFVSILWFVNKCFEPYRLDVIGQALGALAVFGLIFAPIRRLQRFLSVPGRWTLVNKTRLSTTLSVVGGIVLAACVVPLPHRVYAPLEVRPRDSHAGLRRASCRCRIECTHRWRSVRAIRMRLTPKRTAYSCELWSSRAIVSPPGSRWWKWPTSIWRSMSNGSSVVATKRR